MIKQVSPVEYRVEKGFVPNMRVPGSFYVNDRLKALIFDELKMSYSRDGVGGFLPAVKQLANVAALPGIVEVNFLAHDLEEHITACLCPKSAVQSLSKITILCMSRPFAGMRAIPLSFAEVYCPT